MEHSEGTVISVGLKLDTEGKTEYIRHTWTVFESGSEPLDGSRGSPILDQQGSVVGLFGFKIRGDEGCLAVSTTELWRFGYEICDGERRFYPRLCSMFAQLYHAIAQVRTFAASGATNQLLLVNCIETLK